MSSIDPNASNPFGTGLVLALRKPGAERRLDVAIRVIRARKDLTPCGRRDRLRFAWDTRNGLRSYLSLKMTCLIVPVNVYGNA